MEQGPLEQAKRQRFVSILCRYPDYTVEEDENLLVVEQFKQRLEWEKQALKKRGGYEHIQNNLFRPKDYGPNDLKSEKQVASSTTEDDSESHMCTLHSTGKRAQFHSFVQKSAKSLSSVVRQYEKRYACDDLCNVIEDEKLPHIGGLYHFYLRLECIQDCLFQESVKEFRLVEFENPITCLACKLSLFLSDISCVSVLAHLDEIMPQYKLTPLLEATLEQIYQFAPLDTLKSLSKAESYMTRFESGLDKRRGRKIVQAENGSKPTTASKRPVASSSSASSATTSQKFTVNLPSQSPSAKSLSKTADTPAPPAQQVTDIPPINRDISASKLTTPIPKQTVSSPTNRSASTSTKAPTSSTSTNAPFNQTGVSSSFPLFSVVEGADAKSSTSQVLTKGPKFTRALGSETARPSVRNSPRKVDKGKRGPE